MRKNYYTVIQVLIEITITFVISIAISCKKHINHYLYFADLNSCCSHELGDYIDFYAFIIRTRIKTYHICCALYTTLLIITGREKKHQEKENQTSNKTNEKNQLN